MKSCLASCLFALLAAVAVSTTVHGEDWTQWRGPNRDGKSLEKGLLKEWPEDGPELAWRKNGVGSGYSSLSVAKGKIFTMGDLDDGSYVIALNESDGSPAWKTKVGEAGGHRRYPGPRSTPTIDGNQVFALNQHGDIVCLSTSDGKKQWSANLQKDFSGRMMSGWRYSESPLVDGDRVICTPGGNSGTLLALDRRSGKKIWQSSDWTDPAGYSSVTIATISGVRQYIQLTGQSLAGVAPKTGKVLWRTERKGRTAVCTTPVAADGVIFTTSSYGVGCNAFKVSKSGNDWTAAELYSGKQIANHHGGVVLHDDHVYGSSGNSFRCVDLVTGDTAFAERSAGKGATIFADGLFYLRAESGRVALLEATPEGLSEKGRFSQPDRSKERAWAHPVIANGKLYLRDQDLLLCYDIKKK